MNLKEVLSIVAVVLTLGLWAAYIWAVDRTVNVGMGVVSPMYLVVCVLFILAMIAFPIILFWAVSKCSSGLTLSIIWGVTISVYLIMPIDSAFIVYRKQEKIALYKELDNQIADPSSSWEKCRVLVLKLKKAEAISQKIIFNDLLHRERLDLAGKMLEEGCYDIQDFNIARYLSIKNAWETEASRVRIIGFLLDNGCDINAVTHDSYGETSLNVAISKHENELAELLVSRGADVNAVTLDGNDALRRAVELGKNSLAEILVKAGANVARVYPDGKTLLDVAGKESPTYEYLIGCGAKERHTNETE